MFQAETNHCQLLKVCIWVFTIFSDFSGYTKLNNICSYASNQCINLTSCFSAVGCQWIGCWGLCRLEVWKCSPRASLALCPSLMKTKRDMWVCDERCQQKLTACSFLYICWSLLHLTLPSSLRWWKVLMYTGSFGPLERHGLKLWYWVLPAAPAITTTRLWDCCLVWHITSGVSIEHMAQYICMQHCKYHSVGAFYTCYIFFSLCEGRWFSSVA